MSIENDYLKPAEEISLPQRRTRTVPEDEGGTGRGRR